MDQENQNIEYLSELDIAIVNPTWKEDAYDLILKYKDTDQEVIKKDIKFSEYTSIDIDDFYKYDDISEWMSRRYRIEMGDHIIEFDNIPNKGIFFFEEDECLDYRESDGDKDCLRKKTYSIIPNVYIIFKKGSIHSQAILEDNKFEYPGRKVDNTHLFLPI